MNHNITIMAHVIIWPIMMIYIVGLFPQIKLNYRLKSTRGFNDLMLLGYMIVYISQVFYVFCLDLPLGYKVLLPIGLATAGIIFVQRLYYHGTNTKPYFIVSSYACGSISLVLIIFATANPQLIGHITGWVSTVIGAIYFIPQIVSIYKKKSTAGFSFAFISIMAFAVFIELISAFILDLPLQTIFNNIRGLIIYVIFCIQFYLYHQHTVQ